MNGIWIGFDKYNKIDGSTVRASKLLAPEVVGPGPTIGTCHRIP